MYMTSTVCNLSKEEVEEKLAAGVPYVIRQNNPTEERQRSRMRFTGILPLTMRSWTI